MSATSPTTPTARCKARARRVPKTRRYKSTEMFLRDLQSPKAVKERIDVGGLDVLMLRSDPSEEKRSRHWAQNAPIDFGRLAMHHGVIVLNDPNGLAKAGNKMYFQSFPEQVRPVTLITRDKDEIKDFAKQRGGNCVLKPLQGSGGESVFLVRPDDVANLNQMIDAVSRDGYVICQEYLPQAEEGDMRLFLMNGLPLRHKGRIAAFRRVRSGGDLRSNVHAGGRIAKAQVTEEALRAGTGRAAQARPGRDVPGRAGHRRRQAHGDQRLQPGRPGQRTAHGGRQLLRRGDRRHWSSRSTT